jgi:hypothetical protein
VLHAKTPKLRNHDFSDRAPRVPLNRMTQINIDILGLEKYAHSSVQLSQNNFLLGSDLVPRVLLDQTTPIDFGFREFGPFLWMLRFDVSCAGRELGQPTALDNYM